MLSLTTPRPVLFGHPLQHPHHNIASLLPHFATTGSHPLETMVPVGWQGHQGQLGHMLHAMLLEQAQEQQRAQEAYIRALAAATAHGVPHAS
jgi:hypothetical protein